jgi:hypothetical protein
LEEREERKTEIKMRSDNLHKDVENETMKEIESRMVSCESAEKEKNYY